MTKPPPSGIQRAIIVLQKCPKPGTLLRSCAATAHVSCVSNATTLPARRVGRVRGSSAAKERERQWPENVKCVARPRVSVTMSATRNAERIATFARTSIVRRSRSMASFAPSTCARAACGPCSRVAGNAGLNLTTQIELAAVPAGNMHEFPAVRFSASTRSELTHLLIPRRNREARRS
jgi:hypothetical protein